MIKLSDLKNQNIPLLILLASIPLQNIYLGRMPTLGSGLNFLNLLILLSLLSSFAKSKAVSENPISGPLALFVLVYIASTFYGIPTLGELGEGHLEKLKDILITFLMFFLVIKNVSDRKGIVITMIATFLPLPYMFRVFHNQISTVLKWHYDHDFRISGTFMDLGSNEIAAFYAGYTLLLISIFIYTESRRIKGLLLFLIGLNVYSLLYSFSRGGWLSFLFGLAVLFFIKNRKLFITFLIVFPFLSGITYSLLPVAVQERADTIFVEDQDRDESALSRYELWQQAMTEYAKSPVLGIGFHTFHHVNPIGGKDTHNYYVKVLTEQGAIGLFLFLLILYRAGKISLRLFKVTDDPLFKALGLGMFGILASFMLGNMFGDRMSHYPLISYFWVYLALTVRAYDMTLSHVEKPSTEL